MVRVKKRPRAGHTRPLGAPPYKAELARVHHAVKRCPEAATPPRPPRRPRESRECWDNTADRHWVTGVGWKPGPKPAAGASRRRRAAAPTRGHEDTEKKKRTRPKFAVGHVVAEAAEPHSALEVVAVEDGLYTLRYRTNDAWRGHEITRVADELVPFGFLPKRAKPVTTCRED
jgi:hypothetical protein